MLMPTDSAAMPVVADCHDRPAGAALHKVLHHGEGEEHQQEPGEKGREFRDAGRAHRPFMMTFPPSASPSALELVMPMCRPLESTPT